MSVKFELDFNILSCCKVRVQYQSAERKGQLFMSCFKLVVRLSIILKSNSSGSQWKCVILICRRIPYTLAIFNAFDVGRTHVTLYAALKDDLNSRNTPLQSNMQSYAGRHYEANADHWHEKVLFFITTHVTSWVPLRYLISYNRQTIESRFVKGITA